MSPMMRLALPVLAIAGSAYAACSATKTLTIQNSGDASAIASCSRYTGDIAIQTDAPGPIAIDGVQVLDGSLIVKDNSALQQISANSLKEITKDFTLSEVSALNTVNFPELKTVGALRWIGLQKLENLGFAAEIEKADVIDIQNTQLQSLEGINIETVGDMYIANNIYVSKIAMQLGNITNQLILLANAPDLAVTFPNLIWANNMTFRNCSSVELPSLETTNNSLNLFGNTFESFIAPNLTEVGGALAIADNVQLTNISFPVLTEVKDNLQVANNTMLREIDGFPELDTIAGALDFNGNMTSIDLPKLKDVRGAFNIQSTGDVQKTCDDVFAKMKDDKQIKGEYVCFGSVEAPGGEGTTPTIKGDKPKKGAASALTIQGNAVLIGLGALAAAFFL